MKVVVSFKFSFCLARDKSQLDAYLSAAVTTSYTICI